MPINPNKHGGLERPAWIYSADDISAINRELSESGGELWLPDEGDDGDFVKRALASCLSHAISFLGLVDVTLLETRDTPLVFIAKGSKSPDAYVTDPRLGRPLIRLDLELAYGFSDILKKLFEGGNLNQRSVSQRHAFMLTWGLRWLFFHEIAHLGFGHHSESVGNDSRRELNLTSMSAIGSSDSGMFEFRCQEAEADLWATHMVLREVGSQFYQILTDDRGMGRPFSSHLFDSLVVLFAYVNAEALDIDAYLHRTHPHPAVRSTLVNWYARKSSTSFEYFVVDWHAVRNQAAILAEVMEFNDLPNLVMTGKGNFQGDVDLIISRLRERQRKRFESSPRLFRIDL